jgi:Metallo-beta-lactamase superfamily
MRRDRVLRILAPNPSVYTLEGTNTWIVGDAPSIVIDPGPDDATHLREVERAADRVGAILLTHTHPDHAPGAGPLAVSTGAPIHAFRPPPGGVRLRDGDPIRVGNVTVLPIHTPGHTPDHVAFWLERAGGLFTGDAVLGRGTSVIDPPEGDLAAYLRSLRRMRDLAPRTLYSSIEASGSGRSSMFSPAPPARSPRSSTSSTRPTPRRCGPSRRVRCSRTSRNSRARAASNTPAAGDRCGISSPILERASAAVAASASGRTCATGAGSRRCRSRPGRDVTPPIASGPEADGRIVRRAGTRTRSHACRRRPRTAHGSIRPSGRDVAVRPTGP